MAHVKRKSLPKRTRSKGQQLPLSAKTIEHTPVAEFAERAYLNYSMYVILDRALPHLSDGLKPVQRRIVYAMSELNLKHPNKPKKSARTIGDVIGKFHPHGDAACYEAMVLMAQPFSYRYPLIQGQGNWGSYDDPKSFAAMRYTESRLTPYCETLLSELTQGTVKWQPNFDGTLYEPVTFPARLPNILLNGTTGIAVGISTDIPPHNLNDIGKACIALLKNTRLREDEIIKLVYAPDYPTGGEIITPLKEVHEIYKQGSGTLKLRATYIQEGNQVTITSLPYGVSTGRVMDEILNEIKTKKHLGIKGIRDESDEETPVRLVIITKRGSDATALILHLFATTNLEKTCRINLNVIDLDGKPKVLGIAEMLKHWVTHRCAIVQARLDWRQSKIVERREILQGLLIAYLNLDQVIRIIRKADDPAKELIRKFKLSETQAQAILALRLKQLNKLEEIAIEKEDQALKEELRKITLTLSSKQRLRTLVRKEIEQDVKQHQDSRRTQIVQRGSASTLKAEPAQIQPLRIVLSRQSWVFADKCCPDEESAPLRYRHGDGALCTVYGQSNQPVFFLTAQGRTYCSAGEELLRYAGRGEPLSSRFKIDGEVDFVSVMLGQPQSQWLMASSAGYGFVTPIESFYTRNKSGRQVINLSQGARSLCAQLFYTTESALIVALTSAGYMLALTVDEIPILPKGKGVKLINLPRNNDEYLRYALCMREGDVLKLCTGKKSKKLAYDDVRAYLGKRARRGKVLNKQWRNVESVEIIEARG